MAIFLLPFVAVMWGNPATGPARRAPRSGRRLLRFALGVAGTSVGVILLYAFENWHAERAWQRYKHSLMAQGQQFDPEINSVTLSNAYTLHLTNATLREALTRVLDDNGLALKESDHPSIYHVVRPRTIPRSAQARRYYSAAAVLASFESFDEEFRALYVACDRPQSRMNVDTPRQFALGPSRLNFGSYRQVAQALTLHASAQLALSNAPVALRDATALFRLSESLRHPPDLLAAMLQASLCGLHLQVVWEGLAGRRWSAGQLETLESQLQTVNLLADCFVGLEAEQATWNQWLEQTPRAELADQFVESRTAWRLRRAPKPLWALPLEWNIRWCPRGWIRQAQIGYTEAFQDHLAVLDVRHQRVFPARDGTSSGLRQPAAAWVRPIAAWFHRNGLIYVRPEHVSARLQTGVNLAQLACALERYRLAHGHFPDRLQELPPRFLKSVPRDLINGRPLHYVPTDDGQFVLYSVGWEGADHQGGGADWAWRYPAK